MYSNVTSYNYTLVTRLQDYATVRPLFQNFTLKVFEGWDPIWDEEEEIFVVTENEEVDTYRPAPSGPTQDLGELYYLEIVERLQAT